MKAILSLTAVLVFSLTAVWPVLESGDKVRGEEGDGDVNMVQNNDCQAWDLWCI